MKEFTFYHKLGHGTFATKAATLYIAYINLMLVVKDYSEWKCENRRGVTLNKLSHIGGF